MGRRREVTLAQAATEAGAGPAPGPAVLPAEWARAWASAHRGELLLLAAVVGVGLVAHGLNMFSYPAIHDDEGVYAGQALAVLRQGRLTPYTYTYDHAPAGWILMAAWMGLTGGPETFGGPVESGRVLMLLLHLAGIPLLYRVAHKLGAARAFSALAALLYAASPLAVGYQRMLLLDNVMVFWLLVSLNLLLDGWGRLSRMVGSGVTFALAVLTKETALFLAPAIVVVALYQRWRHQGGFGPVAWGVPAAMVMSLYPLYAALKGELLPAGAAARFALFGGGADPHHTSLVEALRWAAGRPGGGPLNPDNMFWRLVRSEWAPLDPALVAGGAIAVLLNLLRGFRDRRALAAGILGVFPLGFLARGGVVFDFYVLVAVPFLCLNLAVLLSGSFRRAPAAAAAAALAAVAMVGWGYPGSARVAPIFAERPADAERQAVAWTKANVSPKSRIITQDDLWPALRQPGKEGPAFPNVHSHWKVAHDPDVRNGVFDEDWRLVDYLLLSPGTERDLEAAGNAVAVEALRNARKMKTWTEAGTTVELWRVEAGSAPDFTVLRRSDGFIRARFERGGAFPDAEGIVRSEAQARAMMRAVWLGDRAAFERAWEWTADNLRDPGGLLAWRWRDGQVEDPRTSADADTEAALALLMAGRLWDDRGLVEEGTRMARAIWQREVVRAGGLPHVAAGDWATGLDPVPLNPGAFAPYAYRVFKEVDPEHDWWGAVEAGYRVLAAASEDRLGQARSSGLPPDWAGLDRSSGRVGPLPLEGRDTTGYSSEAARVFWRVAVDLRWSNDGRARTFLEEAGGFLRDEVDRKGAVASAYAHDGEVLDQDPSMVGAAGALGALLPDPDRAQAFAAERVLGAARLRREATVWGDPADLQTQEWGWLAAALATGAVRDIWHGG